MVKYVLIISQYYHSYVQKICIVQDDFIDEARKMIKELEDYKRYSFEKDTRPVYYGDLHEKYNERTAEVLENGGRINLNDAGDIYFEFSDSINHLVNEIINYEEESRRSYKNFRKDKRVQKEISEHHNKKVVTDIIKKHFVVA